MKSSDFIKMSSLGVYSITFPTDKVVETLEQAVLEENNGVKYEIIKNPITGQKVHSLRDDDGLFFSIRAEFKKMTPELISNKAYEITLRGDTREGDIELLARQELYQLLPASSEIYNIFYDTHTHLLMVNSVSKRSQMALMQLVKIFNLVGVKSIIISDEKLGINQKLRNFLDDKTPLFTGLSFEAEATLYRDSYDEKGYLKCRHLGTSRGKEKAKKAFDDGYCVQSLKMSALDVKFKLDENLKIRSMTWTRFNKTARELNGDEAGKNWIFNNYLEEQFNTLQHIMRCTVLEFTESTKLEDFL